jgi:hypothetical protein
VSRINESSQTYNKEVMLGRRGTCWMQGHDMRLNSKPSLNSTEGWSPVTQLEYTLYISVRNSVSLSVSDTESYVSVRKLLDTIVSDVQYSKAGAKFNQDSSSVRLSIKSIMYSVSYNRWTLDLLQLSDKQNVAGLEVFTAVVMKSIIFWDMTPCSPLCSNLPPACSLVCWTFLRP